MGKLLNTDHSNHGPSWFNKQRKELLNEWMKILTTSARGPRTNIALLLESQAATLLNEKTEEEYLREKIITIMKRVIKKHCLYA